MKKKLKILFKKIIKNRYPLTYSNFKDYYNKNSFYLKKHKMRAGFFLIQSLFSKQNNDSLNNLNKHFDFRLEHCSEFFDRENEFKKIMKMIKKAEIVSFDIFDTAINRLVSNADDIFMLIGLENKLPNFYYQRINGERIARLRKQSISHSTEVTIDEIYKAMEELYNVNGDLMYRELELESILTIKNDFIHKIYLESLKLNKKIIFVSDMYLPKNFIRKLLEKEGYKEFSEIFISNDINLSKFDGSIWRYYDYFVKNKSKIIHLGDNFISDYKQAKQNGINSCLVTSVNNLPTKFKKDTLSKDFSYSIVNGLILNKFKNCHKNYSIVYEHGYCVGGILTLGFIDFINSTIKKNNCDLVLFCARDCDIIYKEFIKRNNTIESKYILVSRFALMNICLDTFFDDLVGKFYYAAQKKEKETIKDILKRLDLNCLIIYFEKEININETLNGKNIELCVRLIIKNKNVIIQSREEQIEAAKTYFNEIISNHKRILIVDVGWNGSSFYYFKHFINNIMKIKRDLYGAFMFSNYGPVPNLCEQTSEIEYYITSCNKNLDLMNKLFNDVSGKNDNRQMIEYLYTSISSSLLKYKLDSSSVAFEFANNKHDNLLSVELIQRGISDFIFDFNAVSKKIGHCLKIFPYVASSPLFDAIYNFSYLNKVYKSFIYYDDVGILDKNSLHTFKQ